MKQTAMKKTGTIIQLRLELLTNIDMLSMVEKGIIGAICCAINQYTEANNKYRKDYDKNKESLYIKFWHISNFYDWGMWQKLPIGSFRWVGKVFQFKEDFIKNYNEDVILDIFLKLMFSVLKNYIKFASSFHIYMKEYKMESLKSI